MKGSYTYLWMVVLALVVTLLLCRWRLQERYQNILLMKHFSAKIMTGEVTGGSDEMQLLMHIDEQLKCAKTERTDWSKELKNDSTSYMQNVLKHTFSILNILQASPDKVYRKDDIVYLSLLVNGNSPFKMLFKFKDDNGSITLIDVENLCPLYQRVNCYKDYKNEATRLHK